MKKEKLFRISMYDKADLSRDYFCGFKPLDFNNFKLTWRTVWPKNCKKLKKGKLKFMVDWSLRAKKVSTTTVIH